VIPSPEGTKPSENETKANSNKEIREMKALKSYGTGLAILAFAVITNANTAVADDCGSGAKNTSAQATMASAKTETTKMNKNIVETAIDAGQFQTLVAAVKAAGLVETLSGKGPFTVFAPTDDAFAKLPAGTVDALLKDKQKLTKILTYHVAPGNVTAADVVKLTSAKTVNGQSLSIASNGKGVLVDNAKVLAADIMCTNGVIHVIDEVLMPN
jgi:uncharacterized surface protein with fasciclin (FAS1) repeats